MPRTTEQNEKIRTATRALLVNSAMTLFARNGFANTTIRHIAGRAGVSIGLTYHYFDSKESLLQAVFENCMAILGRAFFEVSKRHRSPERLPALLRTIFTMLEEDPDFWALFYMMRTQPAIMEVLGDGFRLWTRRLRGLFIADLTAAGLPDPDVEALILYSLVEGTIQQFLLDPDSYPLEAVAGRIIKQYTYQ